MEHVAEQLLHLGAPGDLLEEGLLDLRGDPDPQVDEEHEQPGEAGLRGVVRAAGRGRLDVVAEHAEGLVLQVLDLEGVLQAGRLWKRRMRLRERWFKFIQCL